MIKKLLFATLLIFSIVSIAHAQQFNYQGIARNANGVAISFQDISVRLTIRDLIVLGPTLYSETRVVRTNQFGMINIVIGSPGATNTIGSMSGINWSSGAKYLQVEIDPLGGNNFQTAGTSQLQSVPFAMFANAAYPIGAAGGDLLGSTYPNPVIAPLAVSTIKIKDSAVTTPKIADSAITNSKILSNAVTTDKILDGAITTPKISNKNVTTEKLADTVVTTDKIKNNAVTNEKIADGTIQNIKLVNSSFTLNGLVLNLGGSQSFVVDSAGTNVSIVSSGSTHTFNFPNASIANRGLITANTQTIGGNKIFNNDITAARIIRAGGIASQFLKADGSVDNNIYLTANQPIIVTATGDATGISTSSGTAPVLPLTLATVNNTVGTYGTNIEIPSISVNNKGLVTNAVANPIPTASATTVGLLSAANWNTFNNKQNAIPLGTTAQYFRGDLSLSNFQTDVRAQLSAGTNITYANGQFSVTNNSATLNTLPLTLGGSQTFATGTGGIDFSISSLGTVHTFNLPTASTFARGLLNNTDFTNFNAAFTNRITSLTTIGTSGNATLSANVLNIPNYTYTLPASTGTVLGGIISGTNITNTSGTISVTGNNVINALGSQTANSFFVSPNGAVGLPSFRTMATGDIPDNIVTNAKLANSSFNLGATNIPLGTTANTLTGLTSITSSTFVGPLTGNVTGNVSGNAANVTGIVLGANGGTGINNTGRTITLGGNLTTAGAFPTTFTSTVATNVTLPATGTGTLATLAGSETLTNKTIAAASNTISGLTNFNLSGTAGITDANLATISTAGKVANEATTATTNNNINTIVLRDATGNFSAGTITASLTGNVTGNVTGNSANVTGIVLGANGGTGIDNTGKTITLGGNLTTAGAFPTTLTSTNTTNLTLPTTGTLATLAGTETLTSKTLTTPTINNPAISFTNSNAIVAGTDVQGSGPITNDVNIIITAASAPSGVTLPTASAGRRLVLVNRGVNAIKVYPATGGQIDVLGSNNAYTSIPVNGYLELYATSTTQWYTASNATLAAQWNVTGNSGLTAGTNFLGTTDAVALQFKVSNTFAGQIQPGATILNTSFGLGSNATTNTAGTQNSAFGAGALAVNDAGDDNTAIGQGTLSTNSTGNNNTAVGQGALNLNIGSSNTAIGQAALNVNGNANNNTAVGKSALVANTTGTNNSGVGHFTLLLNNSGSGNTAMGQNSLSSNLSSDYNTAIGMNALKNTTGIGNIGVGVNADVAATFSNSVSIGYLSSINSNSAIAIGQSAIVSPSSDNAISIGFGALTNSTNTISIGRSAISLGGSGISIGQNASTTATNAVAIGTNATNSVANSVQLGGAANTLVNAQGDLTATGRITGTGARFAFHQTGVDYTITTNDYYIKATSAAINITLPSAFGIAGQRFVIVNASIGSINIFTTFGQIIFKSGFTGSINSNTSLIIFSDGANWLVESQLN